MCDIAHPIVKSAFETGGFVDLVRILERRATQLLDVFTNVMCIVSCNDFNSLKEVIHMRIMHLWKSIRAIKHFCCSEEVLRQLIDVPDYKPENDRSMVRGWSLQVKIRHSTVLDDMTVVCINIIGMLCGSAPLMRLYQAQEIEQLRQAIRSFQNLQI